MDAKRERGQGGRVAASQRGTGEGAALGWPQDNCYGAIREAEVRASSASERGARHTRVQRRRMTTILTKLTKPLFMHVLVAGAHVALGEALDEKN